MTKTDGEICKGIAVCLLLFHHLFDGQFYLGGYAVVCVPIFAFVTGFGFSEKYRLTDGSINFFSVSAVSATKTWIHFVYIAIIVLIVSELMGVKSIPDVYGSDGIGQPAINLILNISQLNIFTGTPRLYDAWWYMKLYYLIIFLMPLLYTIVKKMGPLIILGTWLFFGVAGFLPSPRNSPNIISRYFECIILVMIAIVFSHSEQILRFFRPEKLSGYIISAFIIVALFALSVIVRQASLGDYGNNLFYIPGTLAFVFFCVSFIRKVPFLRTVLVALGRHSLTIFLSHIMLKYILTNYGIISTGEGYRCIAFFVLLAASFLVAFVLDWSYKALRIESVIIKKIKLGNSLSIS